MLEAVWNSPILFISCQTSLWAWLTRCLENQITVKRTEQNNPLGLEVQLHITEAVCPALSEPGKRLFSLTLGLFVAVSVPSAFFTQESFLIGLRAFLRFMTGVSVCLNRGDVDPKTQQVRYLIFASHD